MSASLDSTVQRSDLSQGPIKVLATCTHSIEPDGTGPVRFTISMKPLHVASINNTCTSTLDLDREDTRNHHTAQTVHGMLQLPAPEPMFWSASGCRRGGLSLRWSCARIRIALAGQDSSAGCERLRGMVYTALLFNVEQWSL